MVRRYSGGKAGRRAATMSLPPQDGWPPPQQSGPPPNQGQPYGQPGYNPQPPPSGWQQGNWPQSGPSPKNGNNLKWLLVGVAVLLVIGITVGVTVLFTRDSGGGTSTPTSGAASDIASANDTGPVSIITDEPTCNTFVGINNSLSDIEAKGWGEQRATLGPSSQWTPEQRAKVEEVGSAMRNAADQATPLIKATPHRLIRELYEQFVAYGRAYADAVPNYEAANNGLASANVNAASAVIGICNSITYGSASRSIAAEPVSPPSDSSPTGNPTTPNIFLTEPGSICSQFQQLFDTFNSQTADWQALDTGVSASQWTPEQKTIQEAAMQPIAVWADGLETTGRGSGNQVLEDFAVAAALYLRTYASIGDSYASNDGWLSFTSFRLNNLILGACKAAAG